VSTAAAAAAACDASAFAPAAADDVDDAAAAAAAPSPFVVPLLSIHFAKRAARRVRAAAIFVNCSTMNDIK
jgi:hypothetical protein